MPTVIALEPMSAQRRGATGFDLAQRPVPLLVTLEHRRADLAVEPGVLAKDGGDFEGGRFARRFSRRRWRGCGTLAAVNHSSRSPPCRHRLPPPVLARRVRPAAWWAARLRSRSRVVLRAGRHAVYPLAVRRATATVVGPDWRSARKPDPTDQVPRHGRYALECGIPSRSAGAREAGRTPVGRNEKASPMSRPSRIC